MLCHVYVVQKNKKLILCFVVGDEEYIYMNKVTINQQQGESEKPDKGRNVRRLLACESIAQRRERRGTYRKFNYSSIEYCTTATSVITELSQRIPQVCF